MEIANTQKNLKAFGKVYFTIFHIKEDGSRGLQYGNLRGVKLMEVIFQNIQTGTRMVIVPSDKVRDIIRDIYGSVLNNSQRDTEFYNKVLPYSVSVKDVFNQLEQLKAA